MIEIVEVIRRSEQGATRPYICKGDNGKTYYVKGFDAGRRSLICEWIAGNLAKRIDLPIAPFEIAYVSDELIAAAPAEYEDLGTGEVFASLEIPATELSYSNISQVPQTLQQDILVFDWWVRNGDRTLTELGGNPNLLWEPSNKKVVIIDHNQAFDFDLDRKILLSSHVFGESTRSLTSDFFRQDEYNKRLSKALENFDEIINQIPSSWLYADQQQTVLIDFDIEKAMKLVKDFSDKDFWTQS